MIRNQDIRLKLFNVLNVMLLLMACSFSLTAQAGLGIAGGHVTSDELRFSYSVGQLFNESINQSGYYVYAGIQHPRLIISSNAIPASEMDKYIKVYPNPAADEVHIDLHHAELKGCTLQLINIQGQVLIEKNIETTSYVLNLDAFNAGQYLLKILPDNSAPGIFTIIKTN